MRFGTDLRYIECHRRFDTRLESGEELGIALQLLHNFLLHLKHTTHTENSGEGQNRTHLVQRIKVILLHRDQDEASGTILPWKRYESIHKTPKHNWTNGESFEGNSKGYLSLKFGKQMGVQVCASVIRSELFPEIRFSRICVSRGCNA